MSTPTVKWIVLAYLTQHGYDGLFHRDGECACDINALFPCQSEGVETCEAGYYAPCPADCGEHDWHIAPTKAPAVGAGPNDPDTKQADVPLSQA